MNKHIANEIVGWYGILAIIIAYALVSFQFVRPDDFMFQLLNLTGSLGIIVYSLYKKAYASVFLNIFWCIIATVVLLRISL